MPYKDYVLIAPNHIESEACWLMAGSWVCLKNTSGKSLGKILALIQINPSISAPELAEPLGISVRAVDKHLPNLKAAGKLKRIGGAKSGHWEPIG